MMMDGGNGLPNNQGGIMHNHHPHYRGDNSISNAQISHSSAVSQQHQRPSSIGNPSGGAQYTGEMNYKYNAQGGGNGPSMMPMGPMLSGERPMSRGNIGQAKLPQSVPQQPMNNAGQTYQIQQDQQNFHLPASAFQNGVPNMVGAQTSGGNGQPTFHFIANKQKFYAQITPDKALPLFNEKRPFTAANPMNGGIMPQASSTAPNGFQGSKRGHSHNSKQQQQQQIQLQQIPMQPQPLQAYQNPYHLQMASKTHSGAFGPAGLQQMQINPVAAQTQAKFVSSAAQLETHHMSAGGNQLVSIFANPSGGPASSGQGPLKMKIKAPNRNNIKEKEQLYEDAIKLKIQLNSYREENVRLKTKIKILENDMGKQERAMEEFIAKFQLNPGQVQSQQPLSSPLIGGSSASTQNNQNMMPSNPGSAGSNSRDLPTQSNHVISIMTAGQRPLLQQNETFLVMSLKKQVKELKFECLKKEEELDGMRKSLKNTRNQEFEVEVKSYIDECQRLRSLLQDMLQQGPSHPLYQERLGQLEQQRQSNEFIVASLQSQNQDLMRALQAKDEELTLRAGDKAARKEIKQELSKTKKLLREKERELLKLKSEAQSAKKTLKEGQENNSFSTKEVGSANQLAYKDSEKSDQTPGSATQQNPQALQQQVKQLQKKVKELINESRGRKFRIEELENESKKQQEKIQKAEEEGRAETKRAQTLQNELNKLRKNSSQAITAQCTQDGPEGNQTKSKCLKELEILSLIGRRDRISHSDLTKKLKDDSAFVDKTLKSAYYGEVPSSLKEYLSSTSIDSINRALPFYVVLSEQMTKTVLTDALQALKKNELKFKDAFKNEDSISYDKFQEQIEKLNGAELTSDHLDSLKLKYLEFKKPATKNTSPQICIAVKSLLTDIQQSQLPKKASPKKAKKVDKENYEDDHEEAVDVTEDYQEDQFEDGGDKGDEVLKSSPEVAKKSPKKVKKDPKSDEKKRKASGEEKEEEGKEKAGKYMDEEEMLDVAEHCFIRMAESLIERGRTARSIFTKYAIPEQFPDGTVLELLSPIGFLEGVKEATGAGADDLTEMEAACLLRVLAKPELDNAIILNEFTMIMENFGVPDIYDEEAAAAAAGGAPDEDDDDDYDDYIRDEDYFDDEIVKKDEDAKVEDGESKEDPKKKMRAKPKRRKINLNFEELESKGHKILRKLARFLLERYMHPREFYGPAICRQMIKLKTVPESHPVDILAAKDFYSRMKAAGVRRTIKEDENLTKFLRLDAKFPHLLQMKRVVKALEEIAQVEQRKMQEELAQKKALSESKEDTPSKDGDETEKKAPAVTGAAVGAISEEDDEEEDDEETEEEIKAKKRGARRAQKKKKKGAAANLDLMREAGVGNYGYANDYFAGASKLGANGKTPDSLSNKMALLMGGGFTHLNTIEEEKHETQTSNYFRENGAGGGTGTVHNMTESERDFDNNTNMRGSRILDEDLINTSSKYSPHRLLENNEFEFPASVKNNSSSGGGNMSHSLQQRSLDKVNLPTQPGSSKNQKSSQIINRGKNHSDILVDSIQRDDVKIEAKQLSSAKKVAAADEDDYSEDDKVDDEEEHYSEEEEEDQKKGEKHEQDMDDEDESDYEF